MMKTATIEVLDQTQKQLATELRLLEKGFRSENYNNEFTREDVKEVRGKVASSDGTLELTEDELTILWTANSDYRFDREVSDEHMKASAALTEADESLSAEESEETESIEVTAETSTEAKTVMTDGGKDATTVQLTGETKDDLEELKEYERETYESVIRRLIDDSNGSAETDRSELIEDIRDQLERLDSDYDRPESDPVDYAEIETRMERAIRETLQ